MVGMFSDPCFRRTSDIALTPGAVESLIAHDLRANAMRLSRGKLVHTFPDPTLGGIDIALKTTM
jgi:hypothetical protein